MRTSSFPFLTLLRAAALVVAVSLVAVPARAAADGEGRSVEGTVSVVGPDGQPFNVPGVTVTLEPAAGAAAPLTTYSDASGAYTFGEIPPGAYVLHAELDGFAPLTRRVVVTAGAVTTEMIQLEIAAVHQEVTVTATSAGIETRSAAPAEEIKQQVLQELPLSSGQFQDSLPLVPGVVRGPDGLLNVKGARASQSGLTVNSANVTDPVTGEYALNLPIEVVESVEVLTNPYAPEYGKFAGAVTSVATRSGSDTWKVQFQDFMPRLRRRAGRIVGLESATPRLAVGGPIVKGKATILQSLEYKYTRTRVESLPPLQSDTGLESFDAFTQVDWNAGPSDHVIGTLSVFPEKLTYVGLNTFNPQPVTPDYRQRGYFAAVNERKIVGSRSVLESTFSVKQFNADVYPAGTGDAMWLGPDVNRGAYFNRQNRDSRRVEGLATYSFVPPALAGDHLVKVAGGLGRDTFDGRSISQPVSILRNDGTTAERISFDGPGNLAAAKTEALAYVEDTWTVGPRLTLQYGARYDRDTIARASHVAPRLSVAFTPVLGARTVIRGGVGVFYDKINLNLVSFGQVQSRLVTRYAADGVTPVSVGVEQPAVGPSGFRTPRSVNWNVEVEREWMRNLLVRVGYQQRNGRDEYVLNLADLPGGARLLRLDSTGASRYRELQVTARYRTPWASQLVVSYVRSSATGDLNDFNTYFGNFENPVIRPNERGRLPWDAPNRFLVWGDLQLPAGIALAPVFEIRDGFPRSAYDEYLDFVVPRDGAGRYPLFASLDLQAVKRVAFAVGGRTWHARLGVKIFNLTDHFNPRDYQGNLTSAAFGSFYNGVGRTFRGKFVLEF